MGWGPIVSEPLHSRPTHSRQTLLPSPSTHGLGRGLHREALGVGGRGMGLKPTASLAQLSPGLPPTPGPLPQQNPTDQLMPTSIPLLVQRLPALLYPSRPGLPGRAPLPHWPCPPCICVVSSGAQGTFPARGTGAPLWAPSPAHGRPPVAEALTRDRMNKRIHPRHTLPNPSRVPGTVLTLGMQRKARPSPELTGSGGNRQ